MAQLSLVEQNGILTTQELLVAFNNLSNRVYTDKGVKITIRTKPAGGYISTYRLVEDLSKGVIIDDRLNNTNTVDLITRVQNSTNDFKTIASNTQQFQELRSTLENLDRRQFNIVYPESAWQFRKFRVKTGHPYLQAGQLLYGIPNKPSTDPRRSGKFIWLDNISGDIYAYLRQISYEYGFYWYGLDPTFWLYEPNLNPSEELIEILKLGTLSLIPQSTIDQGTAAIYNYFTDATEEQKQAAAETWDKLFEEVFD